MDVKIKIGSGEPVVTHQRC